MTKLSSHTIPKQIPANLFRAYDIRGVVNESLTESMVFAIGMAIGSEVAACGEQQVIIARDGRLSGPTLSPALAAGIQASGRDVIDIGQVPTPVLYFATNALAANSGVMLTGSHNPPNYNGLKIVIAGKTLYGDAILALQRRIEQKDFTQGAGHYETRDVVEAYYSRIESETKLVRPLKIVVDCGNGVAGKIAPALYERLGCEVIPLFCEVDGNFPNHHPDPSVPENLSTLIETVQETGADVGFAFDGDGDRLGIVSDKGDVIWPDRQLMLFAQDVLKQHPGKGIIFDVKCSAHVPKVIREAGGKPMMWKTGHSLIKAKLKETGLPLAGEMSGHIFFNDKWYGFDDGLYTGVRLLEILATDKRSCSEIFASIPDSVNTPELKLPMAEERKFTFIEEFQQKAEFPQGKVHTIDGVRVDYADGFGLIRPSNTTPYLILRFEGENQAALERIQAEFRQQLLALDPSLQLPY